MLPKNKVPTYELTLPISGKVIKYRPWFSVESKKLLTVLLGKNISEIENTLIDILDACTFGELNFFDLPYADIEFLFIQVKMKSKGEIVELTYQATKERDDSTDVIPVELNLADVKITPIPEKVIKFTNSSLGVKMCFPTVTIVKKMRETDDDFKKICYLIETVFDQSQVYDRSMFTEEELLEWIQQLTDTQLEKILDFIKQIPTIKLTLKFKVGRKMKEIELAGMQDFFL